MQFTRNNYCAGRLNGQTAEVVAISPKGAAVYTDNRASLTDALGILNGAQVAALDGHGTSIGLG